ncbi:hypothetical protein BJF90_26065 [Pseudonocardia sp. CNS-004]|nr:hypothetical protein BJF90_26065 [Pseudonocardia sp. CNS-004]
MVSHGSVTAAGSTSSALPLSPSTGSVSFQPCRSTELVGGFVVAGRSGPMLASTSHNSPPPRMIAPATTASTRRFTVR